MGGACLENSEGRHDLRQHLADKRHHLLAWQRLHADPSLSGGGHCPVVRGSERHHIRLEARVGVAMHPAAASPSIRHAGAVQQHRRAGRRSDDTDALDAEQHRRQDLP